MKRADISDRDVLELILDSEPATDVAYALELRGVPYKVALAKLEHMADRGLIDYGVVLNRPWLTPAGMAALSGDL